MATNTDKPVTRRALVPHPRHNRKVLATLGPGDVLTLRLERERGEGTSLPLNYLYDLAERRRACANAGIDESAISPCNNPNKRTLK